VFSILYTQSIVHIRLRFNRKPLFFNSLQDSPQNIVLIGLIFRHKPLVFNILQTSPQSTPHKGVIRKIFQNRDLPDALGTE
jgi:hypothetical protein